MDETSGITRCEQVILYVLTQVIYYNNFPIGSICLRYCSDDFETTDIFLGFYKTTVTNASTLLEILKYVLFRIGLSIFYFKPPWPNQ